MRPLIAAVLVLAVACSAGTTSISDTTHVSVADTQVVVFHAPSFTGSYTLTDSSDASARWTAASGGALTLGSTGWFTLDLPTQTSQTHRITGKWIVVSNTVNAADSSLLTLRDTVSGGRDGLLQFMQSSVAFGHHVDLSITYACTPYCHSYAFAKLP